MIPTFVTFEADPPAAEIGAFDGSAPPPGRPLANALAHALVAAGLRVSGPPAESDSYGWAFEVEHDGAQIWCMLQRSDAWLLITEARRTLGDRLFGRSHEAAHRAVYEALNRALQAHPSIRDVRWYTRAAFDALATTGGGSGSRPDA
ncbi:MAG: hypothetical protein M3P12_10250 [Gemmatimonadota bacterium]|nr:hypothetical protein [Gemmatimonadota bacterium]